jgi:hypothetical protein
MKIKSITLITILFAVWQWASAQGQLNLQWAGSQGSGRSESEAVSTIARNDAGEVFVADEYKGA